MHAGVQVRCHELTSAAMSSFASRQLIPMSSMDVHMMMKFLCRECRPLREFVSSSATHAQIQPALQRFPVRGNYMTQALVRQFNASYITCSYSEENITLCVCRRQMC